ARLYLQQADDLQRVSSGKETPESTREILSEIQRSQDDHQGSYEVSGRPDGDADKSGKRKNSKKRSKKREPSPVESKRDSERDSKRDSRRDSLRSGSERIGRSQANSDKVSDKRADYRSRSPSRSPNNSPVHSTGFGELVDERELSHDSSKVNSSSRSGVAEAAEPTEAFNNKESTVSATQTERAEEKPEQETAVSVDQSSQQEALKESEQAADSDRASSHLSKESAVSCRPPKMPQKQKQQQKQQQKLGKQKSKPKQSKKNPKTAAAPGNSASEAQQREAERRALDSLRGQRVIARNEERRPVLCRPGGVLPRHAHGQDSLRRAAQVGQSGAYTTNDTVLAQVRNLKNRVVCFAPARVLVPPKTKVVARSSTCECTRSSLIKIGETSAAAKTPLLKETRAMITSAASASRSNERDGEQETEPLRREIRRLRRQLGQMQSTQDSESRGAQERIRNLERQIQQLQAENNQASERSRRGEHRRRRHHSGGGYRRSRKDSLGDEDDAGIDRDGHQFEEIDRSRDRDGGGKDETRGGSASDRPPQRLEFRPTDEETSSELARLASRQSEQDAVQPDDSVSQQGRQAALDSGRQRQRQRQLQQRAQPSSQQQPQRSARRDTSELKPGEEVLARWSDDGLVLSLHCGRAGRAPEEEEGVADDAGEDGRRYVVEDGSGQSITESDDAGLTLEHGSTVVALHPAYSYSYAPGVVVGHDSGTMWVTVRFYDGSEVRLPRQECYAIDAGQFEYSVEYIIHREKLWVDKSVVARVNRTGCYLPATVKNRVGSGRQYVVEFSDGHQAVQALEFIFGGLSRRCSLHEGDRVLAQIAKNIIFLPGWVMSVNSDSTVNIKFVDGSSSRNVKQLSCYWLTKEFFDNAVSYWRSRHNP
uniref:Tudor domain-containing protein n=1 Tax=Macrostomum lignano TaxID=282301 RepID=A0A1I8F1M6_9PLAT